MMVLIAVFTLNAVGQHKEGRKGFPNDLSAEEIATLKTKKMTLHLDLTESQQKQIKVIMLEEATHKEKQRAQLEENKSEEKPSKEQHFAKINERLDRQIEMKKQMKNILNETQYEKWSASVSKRNQKKHKKQRGDKSDRKH